MAGPSAARCSPGPTTAGGPPGISLLGGSITRSVVNGPSSHDRACLGRPHFASTHGRARILGRRSAGCRRRLRPATLLLGSVSAEVVDRAPCPVLVARRTSVGRAVLAVDGSPSARAAAHLVASWPAFDGVPIRVVAVAEAVRPWFVAVTPAFLAPQRQAISTGVADPAVEASEVAAEVVAGLREAGREVAADVRRGRAAEEVIAAASESDAGMVVLGCRGRNATEQGRARQRRP